MFPALGAVLGLVHPVTPGVLQRGLKFQTSTNNLNKFFFNNSVNFWVPHVCVCVYIYRVSLEECARLRENVP